MPQPVQTRIYLSTNSSPHFDEQKSINPNHIQSIGFQQPAGGVALYRISPSQGPSSIYGRLSATWRATPVIPLAFFMNIIKQQAIYQDISITI